MNSTWKLRFAAILSVLVLVVAAATFLNQNVSAAGGGSITGSVKISGTAGSQVPLWHWIPSTQADPPGRRPRRSQCCSTS